MSEAEAVVRRHVIGKCFSCGESVYSDEEYEVFYNHFVCTRCQEEAEIFYQTDYEPI